MKARDIIKGWPRRGSTSQPLGQKPRTLTFNPRSLGPSGTPLPTIPNAELQQAFRRLAFEAHLIGFHFPGFEYGLFETAIWESAARDWGTKRFVEAYLGSGYLDRFNDQIRARDLFRAQEAQAAVWRIDFLFDKFAYMCPSYYMPETPNGSPFKLVNE